MSGYKADIVFLDLGHINWIPFNDPTNQIVHSEDGSAVPSVMIAGHMILENPKLLNVDMAPLARLSEKARERLERGRKPAKALYDKAEKVVSTFCPGLAKQPLHIATGSAEVTITGTIRAAASSPGSSPSAGRRGEPGARQRWRSAQCLRSR